jgi:hypothetical protein
MRALQDVITWYVKLMAAIQRLRPTLMPLTCRTARVRVLAQRSVADQNALELTTATWQE